MDNDIMSLEEKTRRRKARVNNLKKAIVAVIVIAILIPTIMCIFLFVKVGSLQEQIDTLNHTIITTFTQRQDEEIQAALSDGVYANELNREDNSKEEMIDEEEIPLDAEHETVAYLTFDDGPSSNTEAILDILNEYNIKATFFVIGKETDEAKELYKRIVDEGHTLGMHSYSHQYSKIYDSVDAFAEDVIKLQDLLEEVTQVRPTLFRFPGGSSNLVSNISMTEFIKFLNEQGITYFDWNVASGDATSQNVEVDTLVENVINDVSTYSNSVILMHDGATKVTTVEALPLIIEELQELEIEMRLITDDVRPVQHIEAETVK